MGGMMMRGVSRCILNFYAAWCYPSLNPRMKSQAIMLRVASVFNGEKDFGAELPPSFAGLCTNKLKPSICSGIQRSYWHSKKVGVGPGALAGRIGHHNPRKSTIAQFFKR